MAWREGVRNVKERERIKEDNKVGKNERAIGGRKRLKNERKI